MVSVEHGPKQYRAEGIEFFMVQQQIATKDYDIQQDIH